MRSKVARLVTLTAGMAVFAGCTPEEPQDDLFVAGQARAPWHAAIVRARAVEPRVDISRAAPPAEITLNLFDDTLLSARLERFRETASGYTWEGEIAGEEGDVTLSVVDGIYAGTIRAESTLYQLSHDYAGHFVVERDEAVVGEHPPVLPDVAGSAPIVPSGFDDGGDTVVDVMVLYTPDVLAAVGGDAAIASVIDLAVAETNQGYAASGVAIHLDLVHHALTAYDETSFDWSQTLSRLQGKADGFMDEIHALRDLHGADHVVLLVETVGPYAGIGYQMQAASAPFFADYAFAVVAESYATGAYTFGHELGHNMGANHDHQNAGAGFFPYSHGLQVPEAGYRTVMAYPCSGCVRKNLWSSPLHSHAGVPTGIADYADNARSLNGTRFYSAAFRAEVEGPPADVAAMLSPVPGAAFTADTVTFTWEDAGALAYRLEVGDAPGDDGYHGADHGQATSVTVSGLPADGRDLAVRLWSQSSTAGWRYHDYAYTAWDEPPPPVTPSTILWPLAGSTLTSTAATFVWLMAPGSDDYRLSVGTVDQPARYYDNTIGLASSVHVDNLPGDGSELLATLYTHGPTGWQSTQAFFIAHTVVGGPALTSPVGAGPLSGITETFTWESSGALQYRLTLQRADGSYVFDGSAGTATEMTVTGLPTNGSPVRLVLFAELPSGWVERSFELVAASHL